MYRTDDPYADYKYWDEVQENALKHFPRCDQCGQYIQDEYFYLINDDAICPECLESNYRKETEDYITQN